MEELCKEVVGQQDGSVEPGGKNVYSKVEVNNREDGPCATPKHVASFPPR